MKALHSTFAAAAVARIVALAQTALAAGGQDLSTPDRPRPVRVSVYPIPAEASAFGAEFDLPSIPGRLPGAGAGGVAAAAGSVKPAQTPQAVTPAAPFQVDIMTNVAVR